MKNLGKNFKARADARRKELIRHGFSNVGSLSDAEVVENIAAPRVIGKAVQDALNNRKMNPFLRNMEKLGLDIPQDIRSAIREREAEDNARRATANRERKIRSTLRIPEIHVDFLEEKFGARSYDQIEERLEQIHNQLIRFTREQLDRHNMMDGVRMNGDYFTYKWGQFTDNTVSDTMMDLVTNLKGPGIIWLYGMMQNGTYFTDDINYDSDGDGEHTRFLASAHNILREAYNVPLDGVHKSYGTMLPRQYDETYDEAGVSAEGVVLFNRMVLAMQDENTTDSELSAIDAQRHALSKVQQDVYTQLIRRYEEKVDMER